MNDVESQITISLYTALQYLRRRAATRTLWVDALCINQTDNVEKGTQVDMMGDIYRVSSAGAIWLGEFHQYGLDDVYVEGCFELIKKLGSSRSELDKLDHVPKDSPFIPSHTVVKALGVMMDNIWWTRIWTIQEVVRHPISTINWGRFPSPGPSWPRLAS